jgi:hypothetical protein
MEKYILTNLIYVNEGLEDDFLKYEAGVLPLLANHNGRLRLRIRPSKENFIYSNEEELPYEVHIVSFKTKEDFLNYKNDPERLKYLELGIKSIKKIRMIVAREENA